MSFVGTFPRKIEPVRRTYSAEEKARAVALSSEIGIDAAAEQCGVFPSTLRCWRSKAEAPPLRKLVPLDVQRAAMRLSQDIGIARAAEALGVNAQRLATWRSMAEMPRLPRNTGAEAKKECAWCGEPMPRAGLCLPASGRTCRAEYIDDCKEKTDATE